MITREQILSSIRVAVSKNGIPPSGEILAKWIKVSAGRLRKEGALMDVLAAAGVPMTRLPGTASGFEQSIYEILKGIFDPADIVYQKRFSACRSMRPYPFDFYIKSINFVIEADGTQHYGTGKRGWGEHCKQNDVIKNTYCKDNGIALLRVRHRRFEWNKDKLVKIIRDVRLHALETGHANCFNCWDGDDLLPISSQADIKPLPKISVETKIDGDVVYYTVTRGNSETLHCVCDKDFYDKYLTYSTLAFHEGRLTWTHRHKTAAYMVLGVRHNPGKILMYKNNNPLDIRKSNLYLEDNSNVPRTKRGAYKTSKTGDTRITYSKATVKGHTYCSYVAKRSTGKKKYFNIAKYNSEEAALQAARDWLDSEGSETIP